MDIMLRYAPAIRALWYEELKRLLIQQRVEQTVGEGLFNGLSAIKADLSENFALEAGRKQGEPNITRLLIGTLLMAESFAYLRRQPEESLHMATGVVVGKTSTVETLVPVALARATVVAAEADKEALSQLMVSLDRLGHTVTGVFHIHPGDGPGTTMPSGVDTAYMDRLAGRTLVFGIWSRDGYCRIMTVPSGYKVQLYGDGVTEIGKEHNAIIYKLDIEPKSLLGVQPRPAGPVVPGRTVVRPSGADRGL
jgi:hypothetical protein